MADLVNSQTNQIEQVPQDNVHQAITSGSHNLVRGQPFNVLDPDGQLISLPSEQIPEALQSGYQIPTQAHITEHTMQQKYGEGLGNEAKAFGLGALSGATFGASNQILKHTGAVDPEALHEIPDRNPISYGAGELGGAAGSMLVAPEVAPTGLVARAGEGITDLARPIAGDIARSLANPETSPIVAKILSKVSPAAAKSLGSAVEGAAYGLGNAVDENALGNSDFNAESIAHNVGYGALYGGALGGVLGLKGNKEFSPEIQQAALKDSIMETAALHPENPIHAPTSLQEIGDMVKNAKDLGFTTDLPARSRLLEADQILAGDSQFPSHAMQVQSLESPTARKFYKTFVEGATEDGQNMQMYEALQKNEGDKLADKFISQISPDSVLTEDPVKGGQRAIDAFTEQYNTEKKALAPAFKQIDSVSATSATNPQELITTLNKAIPEADSLIMRTPDGYEIVPYKASLPVGRETYDAMKDLVETLNEKDVTIGAIRNVRNSMQDRINWLEKPRPSAQISSLRKGLMDYMQDQVQKALPHSEVVEGLNSPGIKQQAPSVRDTFRRYAINEENRDVMERIFGGSISDKASFAKEIKPEDVLNKLFGNTISTKAARELLGSNFDEALANFLKQKKAGFTDEIKNGFSSNKFGTFLKNKAPELDEAMISHPDQYEKIKAINDKMRILPDSPSGNPSGTATTNLMQKIQKMAGYLTPEGLLKIPGEALHGATQYFERAGQRSLMDQILAGKTNLATDSQLSNKTAQYGALSKIERMANKVNSTISRDIKPLLETTSPIKGIVIQKLTPEDQQKKFEKVSAHLQDITQSPEKMIDQMQAATQELHNIAPQTSTSLNMVLSRATQYLAQKLPQPGASSPLSEPYKVSASEIYKFNRTMEAVEKPLSILKHANQGTLTMEGVQAVQAVHPEIYKAIQTEVMNQIAKTDVKDIPYQKKLMLSMLTGNDLTNSLKPANIISAQSPIPPPPQQAPVKQSQAGLKNLNKSEQMLTASQKSAQRIT